jgi:D-lactate dehydrogenase (cytochrome)
VVDAEARAHCIQRGQYCFDHGVCPLPWGGELNLDPDLFNSGLFDSGQDDDLIDLYLGSEGMLGVITSLELRLEPKPSEIWGVVFLFTDQAQTIEFIDSLSQNPDPEIAAIEFMDHSTLASIQNFKQTRTSLSKFPDLDPQTDSAVCIAIHSDRMNRVEAVSERLMTSAETLGCDLDQTWAFCNDHEMEQFYGFRHAAPESLNTQIDIARQTDVRICKLGTDMQAASMPLSELVEMYQNDLVQHRLKGAVFGHAGDGIMHVNILPQNFDEYTLARKLMRKWAENIHSRDGSVIKEHGIGKIKPHLFRSIPLSKQASCILKLKEGLDPDGLWNPGNMKE